VHPAIRAAGLCWVSQRITAHQLLTETMLLPETVWIAGLALGAAYWI